MGHPTAFSFNCTAPPEGVNFVRAAPVRGTLDIVFACLGVLLLSTWNFVDLEIVSQPYARTWTKKIRLALSKFFSDFINAMWTAFAPEAATAIIISDLLRARRVYHNGRLYAARDHVDWDLSKAYYANFMGFEIRFDRLNSKTPAHTPEQDEIQGNSLFSPQSASASSSKHEELPLSSAEDSEMPHDKTLYVIGEELLYLREAGIITSLPELTYQELQDRNKSSFLLQFLAALQTIWLALQVCVRYSEGLNVTQLEIVTLAFAIIRLIAMAVDWYRPKGVNTTHPVYATRWMEKDELTRLAEARESIEVSPANPGRMTSTAQIVSVIGMLFGVIHCLAWNESFPTKIERTLWRVSTVITTLVPLCVLLVHFQRFRSKRFMVPFYLVTVLYALARFTIIAETIRTLFYQPPSTFVATWTANLPHLG